MSKVTRVITRPDGSQVKIVAQYQSAIHQSISVDVYHRASEQCVWIMCDDRPNPDWKTMPVDEYCAHGRSEKFRMASPGEILGVCRMIGRPVLD